MGDIIYVCKSLAVVINTSGIDGATEQDIDDVSNNDTLAMNH
jgi:hypothetical protein